MKHITKHRTFSFLLGSLLTLLVMTVTTPNTDQLRLNNSLLHEQNYILKDQIFPLMDEEINRLQYIQDLSVEFSMSSDIVLLIDHLSRQAVKPADQKWRLVRNHEFLTYMLLSLIRVESSGDPYAIGDGGKAIGLSQMWLTTAKQYDPKITLQKLKNPATNIRLMVAHFEDLLDRYRGNVALALYAYNRGSSKVDSLLALGESPENGYAAKVYQAAMNNNRVRMGHGGN